jgi:hypothetical protein
MLEARAFGIVLVAVIDDKICVLESVELQRRQFDDAINTIASSMLKYGLHINNTKILVDSSAYSSLCTQVPNE